MKDSKTAILLSKMTKKTPIGTAKKLEISQMPVSDKAENLGVPSTDTISSSLDALKTAKILKPTEFGNDAALKAKSAAPMEFGNDPALKAAMKQQMGMMKGTNVIPNVDLNTINPVDNVDMGTIELMKQEQLMKAKKLPYSPIKSYLKKGY